MEHLPKRTSLVHETAATLKEWISTGMLSEVLPGELQLYWIRGCVCSSSTRRVMRARWGTLAGT